MNTVRYRSVVLTVRRIGRTVSNGWSRLARFDSKRPRVVPLLLILLLVFGAWYVAIRTQGQPGIVHSLGVVARVYPHGTNRGRNIPAGGHCTACANGAAIMRFNPGAGLRVDMVVSVHPKLLPWPDCGKAAVDLVISGTPAFWEQHNRLGPRVLTEIAVGWDGSTTIAPPAGVKASAFDGTPQQGRLESLLPNGTTSPDMERHIPPPALVAFLPGEPQAPLHPGLYTNEDLTDKDHLTGAHDNLVNPFPPTRPLGLRTQIADWDGTQHDVHEYALHLHFVANWLKPRGFGSCYVLLPSLLANGAFAGTQNALAALLQKPLTDLNDTAQVQLEAEAQPPSAGRIELATAGSVSLADTNPAPTDFEPIFLGTHGSLQQRTNELVTLSGGRLGPVWTCEPSDDLSYLASPAPRNIPPAGSFPGDACGAVAVVNAPGASDFRATVLIVLGVLIALAFEWFFRRKPKKGTPYDSGVNPAARKPNPEPAVPTAPPAGGSAETSG